MAPDVEILNAVEPGLATTGGPLILASSLPAANNFYRAFTDPSGGSNDSFALAISHKSKERIIIDAIREVRPPFSPDAMVDDFAALLKSYRVSRVTGDRYAGEFPRELFRRHGIAYDLAKQTKSELFRDLLPLLNSGRIVLPRNDRLQGQIVGLERRTSAVGRDTISHPDRGHDDVANAVAGAAALSKFGGYDTAARASATMTHAWQRVRLQAFINSGGRIRL